MHEKLYHLFLISQDLQWFAHEHPVRGKDSGFPVYGHLPKPGMYRTFSDFYPKGGMPQLLTKTVIVPGAPLQPMGTKLTADLSPKTSENLTVALKMEPEQPIAGTKTLMFFHLDSGDGLEKYIGAWAHMLAVSEDLIDTIHSHPFLANGGPQVQFNMILPRPASTGVWFIPTPWARKHR